jgi:N-acetylglucosaminyl-diphospho-decaprenol L-rhamnosyltransferase
LSKPITSISIVSHGQAHIVESLLLALAKSKNETEVIVTINVPSLEPAGWIESLEATPRLRWVLNDTQKSFAANHNCAANIATGDFFCILNPDISLSDRLADKNDWTSVLTVLREQAGDSSTGLAYPTQTDTEGKMLDFERTLVTPNQIVLRHIFAASRIQINAVDWVSGACMMFRTEVFRALGGFDERYRLYCEDVDICLRLQLAGYKLVKAPCAVVHDCRRQTMRSRQHFTWHMQSLMQLWFSQAFWQYLKSNIKFRRKGKHHST